jgi:hypothetical protein
MPDRSNVIGQTKRDTQVLQVGGWGMRLTTSSLLETKIVRKPWMRALEISDGSKYMQHGIQKELRIETWNVLTLHKGGALKQLEKMLHDYKMDTIALQEIRWIGRSVLEKRNCRV